MTPPVAFVLSSGASLGAVQVGMMRALIEHEIRPDLVVGCSVGAINGACLAADPTPAGVARIDRFWRTTDARRLLPRGLRRGVALARRGEAGRDADALRQMLAECLPATTFEELPVPFQCVATDVQREVEAWFERGPLVDAVLASSAVPALFPTVRIDGRRYLDGAIVDDVPVGRAAALGARTLYVLEAGLLARSWQEPGRAVGSAIEAYWIARRHRFRRALAALAPDVSVHLLPSASPATLRSGAPDRVDDLIEEAYAGTAAYLDRLSEVRASVGQDAGR